jgi:hypothetical protein
VRNATRIEAYRRDNGSICGTYQPEDRMSLADLEGCVNDMLDAVDDEGNHEYSWTLSPEIMTVQGIGTIAVLEIELTSSTICGRREESQGIGADEIRAIRAQNGARGWRI